MVSGKDRGGADTFGLDSGSNNGKDSGLDNDLDSGRDSGIEIGRNSDFDGGRYSGLDNGLDSGLDNAINSGLDNDQNPLGRLIAKISGGKKCRDCDLSATMQWTAIFRDNDLSVQ